MRANLNFSFQFSKSNNKPVKYFGKPNNTHLTSNTRIFKNVRCKRRCWRATSQGSQGVTRCQSFADFSQEKSASFPYTLISEIAEPPKPRKLIKQRTKIFCSEVSACRSIRMAATSIDSISLPVDFIHSTWNIKDYSYGMGRNDSR